MAEQAQPSERGSRGLDPRPLVDLSFFPYGNEWLLAVSPGRQACSGLCFKRILHGAGCRTAVDSCVGCTLQNPRAHPSD